MNKRKIFILILFLNLILFSLKVYSAPTGQEPAKECALCHYSWMDEFMFQHKGTDIVKFPEKRVVAEEIMCFSCHDGTVVDSRIRVWAEDKHKVGVKPSKNVIVPKELPLKEGKIVCATCHSAHGTGEPEKEGISRSIFLRMRNENSELCKSCHTNKFGKNNHPDAKVDYLINEEFFRAGGVLGRENNVICESCHTPHGPKEKKLLLGKYDNSELCSYCHTDKLEKGKYYKKGVLTHPVNIIFKDKVKKMEVERNGGIFVEDKIVCLTCHNTHKGVNKSLLIIDNKNDELCFKCHNEKKAIYFTKHNIKKLKSFMNKFKKSPYEHGVCSACHDPHGWALDLPKTDDDLLSRACFSCHLDKRIVKDKVINKNKYNHPVFIESKYKTDLPLFEKENKYFSEILNDNNNRNNITCATCHNSHIKSKNFLRKEVKDGKLCLSCHNKKKAIVGSAHDKDKLNCVSCHKIHNSDNKNLLINSLENVCYDCHSKGKIAKEKLVGEHSHPVNISPSNKITTSNGKFIEGKIMCVSCHDPHNPGKLGNFLINNPKNTDILCLNCHKDKDNILITKHAKIKKNNELFVCNECHIPHNAKSKKYLFKEIIKTENDYCLICHNKDGVAHEKVVKLMHPIGKVNHSEKYNLKELSCISCHDAHNKNSGYKENYFLKAYDSNICFNCHKDKTTFTNSKHNVSKKSGNIFKKFNDNSCEFCHDIHFQKNDYLKTSDNNDRCVECHKLRSIVGDKVIYNSHSFVLAQNINYNKYKLLDGKIVCSTCHDPHLDNNFMLSKNIGSTDELCTGCHKNKKDVNFSEHNLKNILHIKLDSVCKECHKPHNYPKSNNLLWPYNKYNEGNFIEDLCLYCHNSKGLANKKTVNYYGHPKIVITYNELIAKGIKLFDNQGNKNIKGFITCSTCHDAHVWSEKDNFKKIYSNVEGNSLNSFLMYSEVIKLCNTCHGEEGLTRYKYYHTEKYRKKSQRKLLKPKNILDILIGN